MSKKKQNTTSALTCIIVAVALALIILVLFCPIVTVKISGGIGSLTGETEAQPYSLVDMLGAMSLNEDNLDKATEAQITAYTAFFANKDKVEAKVYTIFLTITLVVGILGLVVAVLGLFFKEWANKLKFITLGIFALVLTSFILGFVASGAYSGSLDLGFIKGQYTVSIGWATIVAFVGGLIAVATPIGMSYRK